VTPLLAELLYLDASAIKTVLVSLLIGTPTLSLIGSVGVALTVGLRRGGLLSALIVLPLYIPVLIFGTGAIQVTMAGLSPASELYALGAMLTLAITLAPLATGAALRISLNS
jgi:heme exporter protein B